MSCLYAAGDPCNRIDPTGALSFGIVDDLLESVGIVLTGGVLAQASSGRDYAQIAASILFETTVSATCIAAVVVQRRYRHPCRDPMCWRWRGSGATVAARNGVVSLAIHTS